MTRDPECDLKSEYKTFCDFLSVHRVHVISAGNCRGRKEKKAEKIHTRSF